MKTNSLKEMARRRCAGATADRQMFRICVKSDGQMEREREREREGGRGRERDGSFSPVRNGRVSGLSERERAL